MKTCVMLSITGSGAYTSYLQNRGLFIVNHNDGVRQQATHTMMNQQPVFARMTLKRNFIFF